MGYSCSRRPPFPLLCVNCFELITILGRLKALHAENLVNKTLPIATLDVNDEVKSVADIGADGAVRDVNASHHHVGGKTTERFGSRIRVDCGERSLMAGIHGL